MKHIFLATLLLFTATSFAQTNDAPPATKHQRTKKISLDESPVSAPLPVPVSGIQILPVGSDTSHLGFVQVGMMNKMVYATPDKGWAVWLKDFVDGKYSAAFKDSGAHLLWVVKDLRITERTFAMAEKAYVRLHAVAYMKTGEDQYRYLTTFDTVLLRGGMDVTGKHGNNIASTFRLLLDASMNSISKPDTAAPQTLNAIVASATRVFNEPVYHDNMYVPGVYLTYGEFLANHPSISHFEINEKRNKLLIYVLEKDSSRTELSHPWGICENGELYKYDERGLVPIERHGNIFVVSTYFDAINRKNKSIFWGAMVGGVGGGLIGGAIVGASTGYANGENGIFVVKTIPYIKKQQPEATAIDAETGELMF